MREKENLRHKEESLTEGISDAASTLMDDVTKLGKATREAASDSVDRVQKNVSDLYEKGQDKVQAVGIQVQSYIKKYPLRSLMIAAGAGFVLGFIKRSR